MIQCVQRVLADRNTWATFALIAMWTCGHAVKADDIDDYVQVQLGRRQIPGLSLAVVQDGHVLKAQGYGLANIETHSPVTPDTVFKIGSMSKQFIAAAIMLLIEEGRIRLDDRIDSHLEGLPAAWHDITVRHLMSHTSGLVRDEPHFDPFQSTSNADVIRSTFSSPLAFRPGEKWSYSNVNYYVLAEIITHLSETPWHEFVATHLFLPLQMNGTRMCTMRDIVADRADGYTQSAAGVKNAEIWLTVRPSGAYLSTVADLAKWDAALWDGKILSQESRDQMWTPARLTNGSQCGYGFGWLVDTQQGRRRVRHDGGVPGFTADFERYLDDRLAVIVLTNSGSAEPTSMAQHIAGLIVPALAAAVKKPIDDPEPQLATVVQRLIDGIMKNNLDRSVFAADVAPHISDAVVEHLSHELAGDVKALELMERSQTGETRRVLYRLTYPHDSLDLELQVNKEGEITNFQTNW